MTNRQDHFALAGHAEGFPGESLDDEGMVPERLYLSRKTVVFRFQGLDLPKELLVLITGLPKTEDPALAEERVEHGRGHDQERGETERFSPEGGLDQAPALGRGPRSCPTCPNVAGARAHIYQTA